MYKRQNQQWEENFARLLIYKDKFGDCFVPKAYREEGLGLWVASQRQKMADGELENEKVARLEAIGFVWDARAEMWERKYSRLVAYKEMFGDCNVPFSHKDDGLGIWVTGQRQNKLSGQLDTERVARLEKLGFVWNPINQQWEEKFAKLVAYKKRFKDCNVPRSYEDDGLGNWVGSQLSLIHI